MTESRMTPETRGVRPETKLRLLAMHVTNVAAANREGLNEAQLRVIRHCARLLRDVANALSPPVWNPRQRWDKLEARRAERDAAERQ